MRLRWIAFPLAILGSAASAHICWIEQVVTEGVGVRVFYDRGGLGGGYGPYDSAYIEPGKPLEVSQSAHGFCTLHVAEKDGRIGVLANATQGIPGIKETDSAQEWIGAVPPAPPYVLPSPPRIELTPIVN